MAETLDARALTMVEDALDQPEDARAAWVQTMCAGDAHLLKTVLDLLAVEADAALFLRTEPPVFDLGSGTPVAAPARIGPYLLGGRIGVGGMGAVYRAERDDGLFDRTVAIKLIRPGLFTPQAAARFAEERRILARLRHPHIAQLIDGGSLGEGDSATPYAIMDYIAGQPIDAYARDQNLSVAARIRLVLQLCEAVHFAHQNLVVHADIKPSNILVDADGQAKLLDFGIARLVHNDGAGSGDAALAGAITPDYAAPEQLAGAPATTASDVYALGIVLLELLTGARPYTLEGVARDQRAGHAADRADFSPSAKHPELRGDLDAILRKTIEPDRAARYPSAAALADDLARYLDHRPVAARGTSWTYVASRFARRHRLGVAAAALAVLALVAGLAVTATLYVRAETARAQATQRFNDVRVMAKYMLFDLYDRLENTPRALAVRLDVAHIGQGFLDQLAGMSDAPADLRRETAEGFLRLATVQGNPQRPNLGQTADARRNLVRAQELIGTLLADQPDDVPTLRLAARAWIEAAAVQMAAESQIDQGVASLALAQHYLRQGQTLAPADEELKLLAWQWLIQKALGDQWQRRFGDAINHSKQAIAMVTKIPERQRSTTAVQLLYGRAYDVLAESTFYAGNERGAEAPYRQQLAILTALHQKDPGNQEVLQALSRAKWALGTTLLSIQKPAEALPVLESAVADSTLAVAFEPTDAKAIRQKRISETGLSQAYVANGRADEGLGLMRRQMAERLAWWQAVPTEVGRKRDYVVGLGALGDMYTDLGQLRSGCAVYAEAKTLFAELARDGLLADQDKGYAQRLMRQRIAAFCPGL